MPMEGTKTIAFSIWINTYLNPVSFILLMSLLINLGEIRATLQRLI